MSTLPHSTVLFSTVREEETQISLICSAYIWSPIATLSTPRLSLVILNKIQLSENPKILRKGLKILIWDQLNWWQPLLPFLPHTFIRSHFISNHKCNGRHMKNIGCSLSPEPEPWRWVSHWGTPPPSHPTRYLRSTLAAPQHWAAVIQSGPSLFHVVTL